ncbi:ABC-type multidrug transport system, ATPase component [Clostridium amylolyticum]|uniref:ABC-type multidrug transport system, ATPase component n=1 Tax=Clostridium amylolyticum TaxID=1121298 RepID=A0A1M6FDY4_9CLOT|nr:ATP-binding cassette domain-containing protein [Clostridium amylolyticum]SHI95887.1 ABC-type multidrug transport system, ATPase component [Clostridium amylolyticum]
MNVLKVNNLDFNYGRFQALKDISFEVSNGVVGILGPNGAGKSTTIKLITTLFDIQKGDIFLSNLDYKKDLKEIRKRMGYLPQEFSVYGNLKGREFLEIIASLKLKYDNQEISNHIDKIINELDMSAYIDKKIKQYSGGMKQKLGFAQVIIGNPSLIVVDEPTVGLDPEQRNYIRELLPIISKDRIVLITTHIVEDIEYYCDYLLVIKEGRLIYKGTKENFINEIDGMLWEADVDAEMFNKISSNSKIILNQRKDNFAHVKYISKTPLTDNSQKITPNLQEAYIAYNKINDNKIYNYD